MHPKLFGQGRSALCQGCQSLTVTVEPIVKVKNPAYGRQSISRPMRIVAPMPQEGGPRIPQNQIFFEKQKKSSKTQKTQKRLEICQYQRYALRPEVSNPSGSVASGWTKNTQKADFFEKRKKSSKTEKIIQNAKTQKRLEICQNQQYGL